VEDQLSKKWYVVQTKPGFELAVMKEIQSRANQNNLADKISDVIVPSEEVVEMKAGKKQKSVRKFFPSYVLVNMVMNEETWHMIKAIPNVSKFVGGTSQTPRPISEKEASQILHKIEEGIAKPKPKILFEPGEVIRVKEGPFSDFNGVVEEVNYEKNKLRVAVLIFGRSTPVELEFSQVEKS
jgi:transcriptional antiterminator NusG